MPSSRRRKNKSKSSNDFLKISIAIAIIAAFAFYFKNKNSLHEKSPPPISEKQTKAESKKAESAPNTALIQKTKSLSELLPPQAWPDDYLLLKAPLGKSDSELYLLGMGFAPEGKKPEDFKDPSNLEPVLWVLKKEDKGFRKISSFDFKTPETSVGGLQKKNLKGIPRIRTSDLIDLEGNGMPEIRVQFDTSSELAQAIGFLKWNGTELDWLKAKDKNGSAKVALWISGTSSADAQELEVKKNGNQFNIIQKYGQAHPEHPEKGFEWKTTVWKMKEGVLENR